MIPLLATLLFVNAAFNALVWPRFYARVAKDPRARTADGTPTRFLVVHGILVGVALVIAVVSVVAGVIALTTT